MISYDSIWFNMIQCPTAVSADCDGSLFGFTPGTPGAMMVDHDHQKYRLYQGAIEIDMRRALPHISSHTLGGPLRHLQWITWNGVTRRRVEHWTLLLFSAASNQIHPKPTSFLREAVSVSRCSTHPNIKEWAGVIFQAICGTMPIWQSNMAMKALCSIDTSSTDRCFPSSVSIPQIPSPVKSKRMLSCSKRGIPNIIPWSQLPK